MANSSRPLVSSIDVIDLVGFIGIALILYGSYLICWAAAFIAGGMLMLAGALYFANSSPASNNPELG